MESANKKPDLREMPAYGINEAAHYLGIPKATLRSWVLGRPYLTATGRRFFKPIIDLPDREQRLLSFVNLVEAHVLDAIRRAHGVALWRVRKALEYLKKELASKHPLAEQEFVTDRVDLFVEMFGQLVNISREGQLVIKDLIKAHLKRVERDTSGLPIRLYPFTRERKADEPKIIVIDPQISFGRPVLAGTGIATTIIAQRYKAGESIEELAEDYGRSRSEIEEAIRCELWLDAA
ncbi:MAG: DUF433 domain-containing protein [Deltaproteobacteria bacterium]|nr:MAG: DUF433 domain-containing protein [Deltaproteobacteria bacterium]